MQYNSATQANGIQIDAIAREVPKRYLIVPAFTVISEVPNPPSHVPPGSLAWSPFWASLFGGGALASGTQRAATSPSTQVASRLLALPANTIIHGGWQI